MKEDAYIKDFYNKNAGEWISKKFNSFYHEKPFRKFEKLLKKGDLVIDIGCASGIHLPLFLGIGNKLRYEGIDLSKEMIRVARSRYPKTKFSVADIRKVKTKRKFDAFWAAAILMHFKKEDIRDVFNKISNITSAKAVGYFTLPNKRPNPESKTDKRLFSIYKKTEVIRLLKDCGWSLIESGKNPDPRPGFSWSWYLVRKL